MKITLALLTLIGGTATHVHSSVRHPKPVVQVERCHWNGDEAVDCLRMLRSLSY
jgi:hypothetical protein